MQKFDLLLDWNLVSGMPFIVSLPQGSAFPVCCQIGSSGLPSVRGTTLSFCSSSAPKTHERVSSEVWNRFCSQPTINKIEFRRMSFCWHGFSATPALLKPAVSSFISRTCYALDVTLGDDADEIPGPPPVYPRRHVRDPHKRLGISYDASEMEIQEARAFLMNEYGRHEQSREAIEAAHDTIIFASYRVRKRSKINLKTNLKKKLSESPVWVQKLANLIEVPTSTIIMQRAALFALLTLWTITKSSEVGPAFQVAVSLGLCIYFLNDKLKSIGRACILGFGALIAGWVFGSFAVPALPTYLLPRSWTIELITAVISYVFMWFACTFLK